MVQPSPNLSPSIRSRLSSSSLDMYLAALAFIALPLPFPYKYPCEHLLAMHGEALAVVPVPLPQYLELLGDVPEHVRQGHAHYPVVVPRDVGHLAYVDRVRVVVLEVQRRVVRPAERQEVPAHVRDVAVPAYPAHPYQPLLVRRRGRVVVVHGLEVPGPRRPGLDPDVSAAARLEHGLVSYGRLYAHEEEPLPQRAHEPYHFVEQGERRVGDHHVAPLHYVHALGAPEVPVPRQVPQRLRWILRHVLHPRARLHVPHHEHGRRARRSAADALVALPQGGVLPDRRSRGGVACRREAAEPELVEPVHQALDEVGLPPVVARAVHVRPPEPPRAKGQLRADR